MIKAKYLMGVAAAALVSSFGAAQAEECPRGTLDARYCDRNGDLVADTPTDPADLVDPDTLIFAYTPVEDPAVYKEVWSDFLDYMEEVTGKKVIFFPTLNHIIQSAALCIFHNYIHRQVFICFAIMEIIVFDNIRVENFLG